MSSTYLDAIVGLRVLSNCWNNFWRRTRAESQHMSGPALTMQNRSRTHFSDMLSTPTAMPNPICPLLIELAMLTTDCSPEEHSLFTVDMGTSTGTPAAMAAALET